MSNKSGHLLDKLILLSKHKQNNNSLYQSIVMFVLSSNFYSIKKSTMNIIHVGGQDEGFQKNTS